MKPGKCHKVLFDRPNSEKDPLGFGDSSTFDDHEFSRPAIYGMAKSIHAEKPEPDFISKSVMFLALTFVCWCLAYGAVMTTITAVQWLRGM